tara:strand:- start:431 stop:586 length:156 start_codon:yes stop_codon:yes gene_type:complete
MLPIIPRTKPRKNILGKMVRKNDAKTSPCRVASALGETTVTKKTIIPTSSE